MDIHIYRDADGRTPDTTWFEGLLDAMAQARIANRIRQAQAGNLGDHASVGDGVLELRVHVGAGYRVYCGRHGKRLVVLLCGGDKDSQPMDIKRAKVFWQDWKRRQG